MRSVLKPFFLLLAAVIGFPGTGLCAKKKDPLPAPPPLAVAGEVSTSVGNPVSITLTAGGRVVEPLKFLIRRPPQHGTLSEIQLTGRNTASVIYTPGSKAGVGSDSLTFAVQSIDSPVSAPACLQIKIVELPPALAYPSEFDFGNIFLGKTSVMPIVLKNEGGGNLSGQVFAEPPWSVDGDPHYRMSAGKKASVALEFTPADEREYSGIVRVGSDPRAFMAVRGRGVAPITLAPEEIVVGREPSEARGFLLLLANRTPEPRTISFDWPDFVKAPHEITLQAGGNATVKATIPPDFLLAFNRSVEFQSEGFIGRITLKVDPAPARLVIASGNELNLGNLKNGGSAHGCFTVKNVGGTDARLQITAARELSVTPDPSSLILSPGKEQVFGVDFPATKVGAYVGTIAIKADSENATEVLVKASISKIDVPMLSTKVSGVTQPVEKFLQLAPRPSGISNVEQPLPAGSGPAFEEASVVLSTPHEIEISWKKLLPEMTEYRIERRRIMPGANDTVHIDWLPWPEVRVSIREADVSARFENLMSDSMWTIRIVAVDSAGVTRSRSKPFRVSTQPSTSLAFLWWSLGALCLGALVSLIRFWWREQARQAEAANMRLSRIGK